MLTDVALQRDYEALSQNQIVMENLLEMQVDQVGKDRYHYPQIVLEAAVNPSQQASLLNKLFKDVQKVDQIDFAQIPDSKGDLTKYKNYDAMLDCINVIQKLNEGTQSPNVAALNKLHQILLDARNDFVFGFKTQNFIIMNMYNLGVRTLYELINVCIIDCTDHLRAKLSMKVTSPTQRQIRYITKTTNQFIKMYESGQWRELMKHYKGSGHTVVVEATMYDGIANEGGFGDFLEFTQRAPDMLHNAENAYNGNGSFGGLKNIPGAVKDTWNKAGDFIKQIPTSIKVIAILIGLFLLMRKLVYFFIQKMADLRSSLRDQAEIVRVSIANDTDGTQGVEKQKKLLDRLSKTADAIEYKILNNERGAKKDIEQSNRSTFNPAEVQSISGADFDF